jgi:hypothetical protein
MGMFHEVLHIHSNDKKRGGVGRRNRLAPPFSSTPMVHATSNIGPGSGFVLWNRKDEAFAEVLTNVVTEGECFIPSASL